MIIDQARFNQAFARIDAANAEDPNHETADGSEYPKELLYAHRMSAMLARFTTDASEALQLAVRAQHIQRWKIPRSEYPMTRAGYHQWRIRLRDFHAEIASRLLKETGYDDETIARVGSLLRKQHLRQDAEAQTLEDVSVLVFLESYLEDFVRTHSGYDEAKLIDILRKSLRKMSSRGQEAALTMIKLPPSLLPTIEKAVQGIGPASDS
ncbi:MAG TPA: DUF4202 domain-containing protein [Methylophilaceae bacterium]|nr:DUF4202 domain-containing protein [Methylophilaceae bacterium]